MCSCDDCENRIDAVATARNDEIDEKSEEELSDDGDDDIDLGDEDLHSYYGDS